MSKSYEELIDEGATPPAPKPVSPEEREKLNTAIRKVKTEYELTLRIAELEATARENAERVERALNIIERVANGICSATRDAITFQGGQSDHILSDARAFLTETALETETGDG